MTVGSRSHGDRITDAIARKPSGLLGKLLFRYPFAHLTGFELALKLAPTSASDVVLDVGCGGGVFLREALRTGCTATGLDHSPDMLATAASVNAAAIREERLTLAEGDAGALPFQEASFDKVFCLNAFFFFSEPVAAIAEMARVTRAGGSVAILTTAKQWAGDANWLVRPLVRRMRCHEPETLSGWAAEAGLRTIRIEPVPKSGYLQIFEKAKHPAARRPEAICPV
ncbi:class I SAM-dependent methyltransferase [Methylobacterium sp. Leaf85]|uniref:class I SAM-dependent methyltransferase n=1 Tax=Methylobacterium sp. Leaf85 TaxID=1736241 RepID=UPI0006F97D27|nr:class I SAM-dependent methyltransferase [Methylobacterium sp. Leaf85]KQO54093.1 hypothetical protein ASF08_15830 [Methylobacterium sp. Leaf85]